MNAAVVVVNYGPYHLARAKALNAIEDFQTSFIELAGSVNSHPWQRNGFGPGDRLRTLCHAPFESCSYRELTRALNGALDEIDPDIVVTTSFSPLIMLRAARWARFRRKKAVFFYETTPWDKPRRWIVEVLKRITIARYYDAAFVGGAIHREYLLKLGMAGDRIWQPYDVVDNDYFATNAEAARRDEAQLRRVLKLPQRYFLYVGRLSPEKNLLWLLKAHDLYLKEYSEKWPLVIVGDGPQRAEMQQALSETQAELVQFRAFQQIEELPTFYALAECLILPSTVDPWGLVVNEAMACGLPVLVSRLCGSGFDLVSEGQNGFRFDPYDTKALVELMGHMSSLTDNEYEQMSRRSKEIIGPFCPEAWASNLADCMRVVLG